MMHVLPPLVRRQVFFVAALLFCSFQVRAASGNVPPVLKMTNQKLSKAGHAKLRWEVSRQGEAVEVQQASDEHFLTARTIYRGHDQATFISGLDDGTYYYRVRHVGGAWSNSVLLTVKHHSLRIALVFFTLGAVVFALTVFIVVKGALHASVD